MQLLVDDTEKIRISRLYYIGVANGDDKHLLHERFEWLYRAMWGKITQVETDKRTGVIKLCSCY